MRQSSKRYAVIIPTRNRLDFLKKALESVASQTIPPSQVCLVIDEEENFEKYRILRKLKENELQCLEIYFTGGGAGGAKARNIGLDLVKEVDYVFFLDDDDEWLPEKSKTQIKFLEESKNVAGVSCANYTIDSFGNIKSKRSRVCSISEIIYPGDNPVGSFSFFGMRWDAGLKNLRLDERFESYQDGEFYIRVLEHGRIVSINKALAKYRVHKQTRISGSSANKVSAYKNLLKKNKEKMNKKQLKYLENKIKIFEILDERRKMNRSVVYLLFLNLINCLTSRCRSEARGLLRFSMCSMIVHKRSWR